MTSAFSVSEPIKYKVNDVVNVLVRRWHQDPDYLAILDANDPTFGKNPQYIDSIEAFRVIGQSKTNVIVELDESLITDNNAVALGRMNDLACETYNLDKKFVGRVGLVLQHRNIVGKNSRKTYELYQTLHFEDGATCEKCNTFNEYADPTQQYICRSCRQYCASMGVAV